MRTLASVSPEQLEDMVIDQLIDLVCRPANKLRIDYLIVGITVGFWLSRRYWV